MRKKTKWLIGIDEAGRGPLAGPITLAFVAAPVSVTRRFFRGIKDSKHLSLKAREDWQGKIKNHPRIMTGATSVGSSIIDKLGITKSVIIGIRRLLRKAEKEINGKALRSRESVLSVLLDGGLKAPDTYKQKVIIKGDEKIPVISAASIIAKVSRDRKMVRFARNFPGYGFEIHKGYGTSFHYKMLKKYGPCEIHRRYFLRGKV